MNGAVICIRVFDLKGKKATPTASGGAVPKLAAAKHVIYFRSRSQNGKKNREKMAEGKGFEPPKGISSFNDLANRRLQPLGHPPAGVTGLAGKFLASSHVHNTRRMLPFS